MLVEPDLTEAIEPLPPGTYSARIIGSEAKVYPKGTKYQQWKLETFGAEDTANNNRAVIHRTPTEGRGVGFLQKLYLAAVGEKLEGGFDTDQLLGKEVRLVLVDGKDQNGELTGFSEVKNVLPI